MPKKYVKKNCPEWKYLNEQHKRVQAIALKGQWNTLAQLAKLADAPESCVSAQLRHLKKPKMGSYVLEKRAVHDRTAGLYEYRIMPKGHTSDYVSLPRRNKYKDFLSSLTNRDDVSCELKQLIKDFIDDKDGVRNRYGDEGRRLNGMWGYDLEKK